MLSLARNAIEYPLKKKEKFKFIPNDVTGNLKKKGAVFVTLYVKNELHGCIGSVKAWRMLAEDIMKNSYSAAFEDSRFDSLSENDLEYLKIEISLLSEPVQIMVKNETDLVNQINQNTDGLILKYGLKQATFLPTVWEKIPEKREFVRKLKLKAGLPGDFWSDNLEFFIYNTEKVV